MQVIYLSEQLTQFIFINSTNAVKEMQVEVISEKLTVKSQLCTLLLYKHALWLC